MGVLLQQAPKLTEVVSVVQRISNELSEQHDMLLDNLSDIRERIRLKESSLRSSIESLTNQATEFDEEVRNSLTMVQGTLHDLENSWRTLRAEVEPSMQSIKTTFDEVGDLVLRTNESSTKGRAQLEEMSSGVLAQVDEGIQELRRMLDVIQQAFGDSEELIKSNKDELIKQSSRLGDFFSQSTSTLQDKSDDVLAAIESDLSEFITAVHASITETLEQDVKTILDKARTDIEEAMRQEADLLLAELRSLLDTVIERIENVIGANSGSYEAMKQDFEEIKDLAEQIIELALDIKNLAQRILSDFSPF